MSEMTSNRPYLIRAIHEWICDNGLTTHLAVNAGFPGVEVPQDFVQDGQIVLNIAPRAVTQFVADNDEIAFSARFGGMPMTIRVPINAVVAIFARENGQGMAFDPVDPPEPPTPTTPELEKKDQGRGKVSHLKVVK
ncbi:MAG: peptidase [Alcanivorax borkumensis]|jgi:stringent starvation protein B|uniref:Stringent starvation protein B n=1 Tax=Alcanivorax borkumensis (strain ATCC 700651 / DSM 11573 / NCIMB 13689 / SK2) TaxID=393595 RepID=Q0VS18_ALCBS|nr:MULTISPECIES: ClpXP protease specificity-enhancing factor [Alcanivorax]OJH07983.1 MAG: peptidase [Alcanivorax borkumensis]BAP13450.1 stringent starvation protein B [Alcanivorax sp. NBRC 101098]CAL16030.1 stringent starvation protein B [Alcanivorax borkumensis SK2]